MQTLSKKLDQHLTELAWSVWTELGVAGLKRKHQNCLIAPEELILLTAAVGEADPRLRDEALDWCSRYHHYISISRLRTLAKSLSPLINKSFSIFAVTLNSISRANWPLLIPSVPLKCIPSQKSKSPKIELPALLYFRLRALFGVSTRADLMVFFLMQEKRDFSISDATEIGYTKRNLADVLESLARAGILKGFTVRNQRRYYLEKREELVHLLGTLPKFMPPWFQLIEIILTLRHCILRIEEKAESIKIVEIRNILLDLDKKLRRLNLSPPPMQADFHAYWNAFCDWILNVLLKRPFSSEG